MFDGKRSRRANIDAEVKCFPLVIYVDCACAYMYTHTHTQSLTFENLLRGYPRKGKMN